MPRNLAIFDFDHTLIAGDSFWPFLTYACGYSASWQALAKGTGLLALRRNAESPRSFLKAYLMRQLLVGRKRDSFGAAIDNLRRWQKPIPETMRALQDHRDKGDMIVIASGGLDLYLPELIRELPYNELICTDTGIADGILTGEMINGNCVRQRKAELVGEWMAAHGPFDETFGYGNYPHDVPMLNLLKHRIIVS